MTYKIPQWWLELPKTSLLKSKDICDGLGISASTFYSRVKRGDFPKPFTNTKDINTNPFRIGGVRYKKGISDFWRVGDVINYLKTQK